MGTKPLKHVRPFSAGDFSRAELDLTSDGFKKLLCCEPIMVEFFRDALRTDNLVSEFQIDKQEELGRSVFLALRELLKNRKVRHRLIHKVLNTDKHKLFMENLFFHDVELELAKQRKMDSRNIQKLRKIHHGFFYKCYKAGMTPAKTVEMLSVDAGTPKDPEVIKRTRKAK